MEKDLNRSQIAALKAYPYQRATHFPDGFQEFDRNSVPRTIFQEGYEQAEKDTIERIREQVERWMPDNPESDEYLSGERVAFRSVLHLLKEMEEEI